MTKVKLISCLSVFALSLSMLVMGVLALATQTITLTGEVGFNVSDKSVYVKDARISDETITGFMPGYINDGLILSDATISGSSFEISLDVINTTTNNFDIVIESSQSGVSVTTEAYIPANSTALTEITSSTPITDTIVLTVTNSTSSPVDLTNILIKVKERTSIQVTVNSNDDSLGTVTGSGDYDIGDTVTLSASETDYGVFVEWRSDSITGNQVSTNATYSFELTASSPSVYYAIFERYSATLSVRTNNSSYGTVTGGGTYEAGDTVTLRATETSTGDFVDWRRDSSTGGSLSTNSTYTFTFTKNSPTTIYGYFQRYSVGVFAYSNNSDYGTVSGSGKIHYAGNTVTLTATPTEIGRFVEWRSESTSGTVVSPSPTYTFTLTKSVSKTYYAIFELNDNVYADFEFNNIDDSTGELVSYSGSATDVDIPATYATIDVGGETFYIEGDDYTVTRISAYAFQRADDTITSVNIPDTVTEIRNRAFSACTKLSTVNFPTSLKTIGPSAFYNCDLTGEINLPLGVETIDTSAFRGNEKITKVVLPSSITSLGLFAFGSTYGLIEIEYNIPALADLSSTSNVFNQAGTNGDGITVTFGSNVTRIPAYLFSSTAGNTYPRVTTVNIPSSVTYIGRSAFEDCSDLTEANFDVTSGWYYTSSSSATTGTTISGLSGPATAAEHLKTNYASYYWKCNPVTIYEDFVFNNLTSTTGELVSYTGTDANVIIPDTYSTMVVDGETVFIEGDDYTVTAIADGNSNATGAFYSVRNTLTSVSIPDTVTKIGDYAFWGCNKLTDFDFPTSIRTIGNFAFTASGLTGQLDLPNTLSSIGNSAFANVGSITGDLVIPNSVTSIGTSAFARCTQLDGAVTLSTSLLSLSAGTFQQSGIRSINITDNLGNIDAAAFESCYNLTFITFSNNSQLKVIATRAFRYCSSLTSITIPEGVTSIGSNAFDYCTSLTSVTFENRYGWTAGTASISASALSNTSTAATYLKSTYREETWTRTDLEILEGFTFNNLTPTTGELVSYTGAATDVVIPSSYSTTIIDGETVFIKGDTYEVVNIVSGTSSSGPFYSVRSRLISVTIPETITTIGDYAFSDCTVLTKINYNATAVNDFSSTNYIFRNAGNSGAGITVNVGANVTRIPDWMFCPSVLSYSYIPNIIAVNFAEGSVCETIGGASFWQCSSLISINVPDSVTSIGGDAFNNCGISEINIPEGITKIEANTFRGCIKLSSITIPESVTSIGSSAFAFCSGLTSITIPSKVTIIDEYAFEACDSITSIIIGASVTSIGGYAFRNCDSLTRITIPASVTSIGALAFDGCESLTSVTFENRNGWTAGTESISASAIASTTTAATYLTSEYKFETWTRS